MAISSPSVPVVRLSLAERLSIVFTKAAKLLPGEAGNQLLAFLSPAALATMAVVLVAWAGSHFFGVGEIADIILLVVGWVAVGGVALEAGNHIIDFVNKTINAKTDSDLDAAAKHLARAMSLLGVQLVLALLLRKKPGEFKQVWRSGFLGKGELVSTFPKFSGALSSAGTKTKLIFTRKRALGSGATDALGNIKIGRAAAGRVPGNTRNELLTVIYHERVHQFLTPKLGLLRNIRIYVKQSGYARSFMLRYLEEALAETIAQLRVHGMSGEHILKGLKFPLQGTHYQITYAALGMEARGLLLGPVTVGGMLYNVYYGMRDAH